MVVGVGNRSSKEYTALAKAVAFKEVIQEVVKEKRRVEEINDASKLLIKETIEYWLAEYYDTGDDKASWTKEHKELFKIRINEAFKNDLTTRLAFEREFILMEEAKGDK